ncbi:MFS transporter [Spirosoma luteum]|uniref:MFS transporter n=1 Tax=Spirosoma luteum TaxID=431553 RepID=UPI00037688C5|nr:MFS transporter [Spirosoma luteum]
MLQRTVSLYQRAYRGLSPSVWLLAGVMLINRCGTMVLPFMTLYLTQQLHYSVTKAGTVMAVYGAGAFVGTFLGGRLTDRIGFHAIQVFSLLAGGIALILLQFVTDFYLLCGSVFTFTLLGDTFRPANQAAIAYYSDTETRTRAFSFNRLAINLGWAVGGGLGGWLASIQYNLLFWVDGLTCVAAGIVLWLYLPIPTESPADRQTRSSAELTHVQPVLPALLPHRDPFFIAFVVCNTLYLIAFMQLFTMVPLFFKERLHLSEGSIGLLMTLNGLLVVAIEMALVYTVEEQKRSKIDLIILGVLLTAVSYAVLALSGFQNYYGISSAGAVIALLYILFVTASEMLVMPFLQSFTVERASPATRGQYLALYAMGGALAQTAAPALGSLVVASAGFSVHWLAVSGISLVSAGGFWWLGRQQPANPG